MVVWSEQELNVQQMERLMGRPGQFNRRIAWTRIREIPQSIYTGGLITAKTCSTCSEPRQDGCPRPDRLRPITRGSSGKYVHGDAVRPSKIRRLSSCSLVFSQTLRQAHD